MRNTFSSTIRSFILRVGLIPKLHVKIFEQLFWRTTWRNKKKEKHSGTRNRDTFPTVLFVFRFVTPFPKKLDRTILFLSLSDLWLSRRYFAGNQPRLSSWRASGTSKNALFIIKIGHALIIQWIIAKNIFFEVFEIVDYASVVKI